MIGLVLVTHGRLAIEFRSALEHVVGPQRQIEAVTIGPDDDVEQCRSVRHLLSRADAEEHVVGAVVAIVKIVGVVGRGQGKPGPCMDPEEGLGDASLLLEAVVHDLEVEAIPAEDLRQLAHGLEGRGFLPRAKMSGDLAREAPRQADTKRSSSAARRGMEE